MTFQPAYCELPTAWLVPSRESSRAVVKDDVSLVELAQTIQQFGIIQPIVVRKMGEAFGIVAGERRWRAAQMAGLQHVPVIVRDDSKAQSLQVALIENLQRCDLDPLEEASAYRQLIVEHHLTHDDLAKAMGKSRATITNRIRLLNLPVDILQFLTDGRLTAGHIRPLIGIKDPERALSLARQFVVEKLSTTEVGKRVAKIKKQERAADRDFVERDSRDRIALKKLALKIGLRLGVRVQLIRKGAGMRMVMHCASPAEAALVANRIQELNS